MDKKTTSNYLYNLVYQILCIIAPLATSPYIARVLGAEGVGTYSYTSTMALTFSLFAALGANNYGQREIAMRQNDRKARSQIFWELFGLRFVISALVSGVYVAFCFSYKEYTAYLLQSVFIVLAIMFDVSWLYMGMEDFKIITTNNIMIKLLTIACVFLFVREPGDVGVYILINALSSVISAAYFLLFLPRYVERVPLRELKPLRHLPGVIQFFIPIIAVQIYSQIDKLMLGAMGANIAENGYYEQARKLTNLVVVMTTALNAVLLPRLSSLFGQDDQKQMVKTYQETFRLTLTILLPIATGLFMISDEFVLWFLGAEFAKTAVLLKWSCALIVLMTVGSFVGVQYLSPTGQQNKMSAIYIAAAVVNVILNLIMIPKLLSVGAIIASVIAEVISCGAQIWLLKRSEYNFKMLQGAWKYILGAGVMAAVLWLLDSATALAGAVLTVSQVALGAAVYFVMLLLTREEGILAVLSGVRKKFNK